MTPLSVVQAAVPGGDLIVLVAPDGAVVAAGFAAPDELAGRLPGSSTLTDASGGYGRAVAEALAAYATGDHRAVDAVPVRPHGGPFHRDVRRALRAVPAGTTVTYAALAALVGRPGAARAAGAACAGNLVAVLVPCHRVVRGDGDLGGYLYGLPAKRALLQHESSAPGSA